MSASSFMTLRELECFYETVFPAYFCLTFCLITFVPSYQLNVSTSLQLSARNRKKDRTQSQFIQDSFPYATLNESHKLL